MEYSFIEWYNWRAYEIVFYHWTNWSIMLNYTRLLVGTILWYDKWVVNNSTLCICVYYLFNYDIDYIERYTLFSLLSG